MSAIRILHLLYSLDPGGLENGVVNIANGLSDQGFLTRVACIDRAGAFAARLVSPCDVSVMGRDKKGGFSPKTVFAVAKLINRFRPHVLHTHNLGPLIYGALGSLGGIACPILHGEHAALTPDELTPRRLRQRRGLYRTCHAIHTVSRGLTRQLAELGFDVGRIATVVNGVDTGRFTPGDPAAERLSLGLPATARVIGMVGRFGPFKRHGFAIDAFEQLASRKADTHLLLVGGGGPLEAQVRQRIADSPFSARIVVTGHRQDPAPLYRAMDLLLIPSENEGMSNAMLEAMASAVPVLSNETCGAQDVIEPDVDGFVMAMAEPGALAGALTSLIGSDRWVAAGGRAREKTLKQHAIGGMISRYGSLYRAAANREIASPSTGEMDRHI